MSRRNARRGHATSVVVGNVTTPTLAWASTFGSSPTITAGTWTGSPVLVYDLYRDGVVTSTTSQTRAQANAYVAVHADVGAALKWREKASGTALYVDTNVIQIVPVNTAAPVASGAVSIGGTLSTTTGTWDGADSYTYQWQRAGVDIGSATASTYTPVIADLAPGAVGGSPPSITCNVKGVNEVGSSAATSSNALAFALPTTNIKGDWDSFTASHYTLASGRVSTALDQSGASNDLAEGTASIRPTIATAGAPDGVHDAFNFALNAGSGVRLRKTAMGLSGQPVTVYSVTQVPASGRYVSDGGGTNNARVIYDPAGASLVLFTVASGAVCSVAATPGAWAVVASVCNGASSAQSINGGAQSTGNLGSTTDDGHCMGTAPGLNASTCLNAKLARQIVYEVAHTASQVADISAYLKGWAGL